MEFLMGRENSSIQMALTMLGTSTREMLIVREDL